MEEFTELPYSGVGEEVTKLNETGNNGFINGAELLNMGIIKLPTLIEPIIPKVGIVGLIGSSDIGKSTLLLQLCTDIVLEDKFLDFPINAKHKKAIYVITEDGEDTVSNRLQRVKGCDILKIENLKCIFETDDLLKKLDEQLTKQNADIVAIDTLADIFPGDMNQMNLVRGFMYKYHQLARKHKCVIIFNHHTGKNTEEKPPSKTNSIGSAGFEGKCRVVMELRKDYGDNKKRHLCIVKGNNLGVEYKSSSYELEFDFATGFKKIGKGKEFKDLAKSVFKASISRDVEKEIVLKKHEEGKSVREIAVEMKEDGYKVGKTTVSDWIRLSDQKRA